ncbi:acyl-CoA dehydrogenase family protein [Mycobacterium asiaticum]|uniref:Acyl-CoA dehydrogenase n=1 Tax=Mycobacterium asiaticum TaxID=1790 RepID=A0A1A3N0I8_MYCAS|nr:acyl-CoA dehydrogenase family protein [Mycobacterium asiaticum]OBK14579.1 acyl-CoA dehydrogenase [Mycobacterium asiaticum]
MRLLADQDERDLAAMCRSLLSTHAGDDKALWTALGESGVLGLGIPEEFGGSGGGWTDLGVFCLEAGRALCPLTVHSTLFAALAIDVLAGPSSRALWLPGLTSGTLRASTALWNPRDAGVLAPTVRAAADPRGGWSLSGVTDFVADADSVDLIVVSAETDYGITVFVVDVADVADVEVAPLTMMGGHRAGAVTFDGVLVDDPRRVFRSVTEQDLRRVANAATALLCLDLVGVGEAVVQRTVEYTRLREQFGRPIASFQAAQHLVAQMHIALSAARLAAHSAVFWIGRGDTATRETAIARMHAAKVKQITLDAHQLHGGMGYVLETDLHLFSERARVLATLGGGADVAAGWLDAEMDWNRGQ